MLKTHFTPVIACVASVSIGFTARSRHFSLFDGVKIGASALIPFCARPNVRAAKKRKMLETCGKPYGNACYAGYSGHYGHFVMARWWSI